MNNQQTIISKTSTGLYCELCKKSFIDTNQLDLHLNSNEHNEKLGNEKTMKKITVEDIRTKLFILKQKKIESKLSPEEKEEKRLEWKLTTKERKREWKERQLKENKENKRSRSNSRERENL